MSVLLLEDRPPRAKNFKIIGYVCSPIGREATLGTEQPWLEPLGPPMTQGGRDPGEHPGGEISLIKSAGCSQGCQTYWLMFYVGGWGGVEGTGGRK